MHDDTVALNLAAQYVPVQVHIHGRIQCTLGCLSPANASVHAAFNASGSSLRALVCRDCSAATCAAAACPLPACSPAFFVPAATASAYVHTYQQKMHTHTNMDSHKQVTTHLNTLLYHASHVHFSCRNFPLPQPLLWINATAFCPPPLFC